VVDSTIIGAILQNAGVGAAIMVVLILSGIIDPSRTTKRAEEEAERWHKAWEASQAENTELRLTVAAQTSRADTAVEATKRLTEILEARSR
jgi:hypothetical protein